MLINGIFGLTNLPSTIDKALEIPMGPGFGAMMMKKMFSSMKGEAHQGSSQGALETYGGKQILGTDISTGLKLYQLTMNGLYIGLMVIGGYIIFQSIKLKKYSISSKGLKT